MPTTTSGSTTFSIPSPGFFGENPASATNFSLFNSITYYQRVYSSGLSQWCYYLTIGTINTSPASSATSPNWTGTISNHQIITTKTST